MKVRTVRSRREAFLLLGAMLAFLIAQSPEARADGSPTTSCAAPAALMGSLAHTLLTDIDAHRTQCRADPAQLDDVVGKVVLPHLDVNLDARLVLARRWDDASLAQRRRFTDAFYRSLLHDHGAESTASLRPPAR